MNADQPISWRTDDSGRALVGGVHDARISGFSFAEGDCLRIAASTESGGALKVELQGIGELNVRELRNGSVLAAIYIWNVRAVPTDSAWDLLFAGRYTKVDAKELAARIALKRPRSFLVNVECLHGIGISAVCDDVFFSGERA